MASIRKRGDKWEVFVFKLGVRKSKTLPSKTAAKAWAATTEAEILAGKTLGVSNNTFGELLDRYANEVSVTKKGKRWEQVRIDLVKRDPIADVKLATLDSPHFAEWRDRRLQSVSPASVRREWNLLSNALNIAMKEWKWIDRNPMKDVRRPPPTAARERIATQDEIDQLTHVLGYSRDEPPTRTTARVGAAMLFSIETAMRAGEVVGLTWEDVDIERSYLRIRAGKTSASRRDVPLSTKAKEILQSLPSFENNLVFSLTTGQIDALFRKAKAKALVEGLTWHDFRHTAITRLANKLDILPLAKMIGHRDLKMLLVYYNPSAEDLAAKLK